MMQCIVRNCCSHLQRNDHFDGSLFPPSYPVACILWLPGTYWLKSSIHCWFRSRAVLSGSWVRPLYYVDFTIVHARTSIFLHTRIYMYDVFIGIHLPLSPGGLLAMVATVPRFVILHYQHPCISLLYLWWKDCVVSFSSSSCYSCDPIHASFLNTIIMRLLVYVHWLGVKYENIIMNTI